MAAEGGAARLFSGAESDPEDRYPRIARPIASAVTG